MEELASRRDAQHAEHGGGGFLATMIHLALPIALQNVLSASLNFVDSIMVGRLGDTAIASVGLANQVFFVLLLFLLGVHGGASMFVSQLWGRRDVERIRRVQGLSLVLAVGACTAAMLVSAGAPGAIMGLLSADPAVVATGSTFLRLSAPGFLLFGISATYSVTLRSTGHPRVPLVANVVAVVANTVLNYALIFGRLGLPRLGVPGSAIATCIARAIECAIILAVVYAHRWPASARLGEMLDVRMGLVRQFFAQSGLLIFKDVSWAAGILIYTAIYSRMGTSAVASLNILNPVIHLSTVVLVAIANSCQIMVGHQLGSGNHALAYAYAGRFLRIAVVGGAITGALAILCRHAVLLAYQVTPQTAAAAAWLIIVWGACMPLSMFNMLAVVGVMRSGGDTMVCIVMDLVAVYLIGLPLALAGAFLLRLPIAMVFALVQAQELFKAVVMYRRFVSGKWVRTFTYEPS